MALETDIGYKNVNNNLIDFFINIFRVFNLSKFGCWDFMSNTNHASQNLKHFKNKERLSRGNKKNSFKKGERSTIANCIYKWQTKTKRFLLLNIRPIVAAAVWRFLSKPDVIFKSFQLFRQTDKTNQCLGTYQTKEENQSSVICQGPMLTTALHET